MMNVNLRSHSKWTFIKMKRDDMIDLSVRELTTVAALAVISGRVKSTKCCRKLQTGVAAELRSSSTVITLSASGRRKSPGQERHITPPQRQHSQSTDSTLK